MQSLLTGHIVDRIFYIPILWDNVHHKKGEAPSRGTDPLPYRIRIVASKIPLHIEEKRAARQEKRKSRRIPTGGKPIQIERRPGFSSYRHGTFVSANEEAV